MPNKQNACQAISTQVHLGTLAFATLLTAFYEQSLAAPRAPQARRYSAAEPLTVARTTQ
jgi:hypothetical protein